MVSIVKISKINGSCLIIAKCTNGNRIISYKSLSWGYDITFFGNGVKQSNNILLLNSARDMRCDVVLVDTAGRMQDNEPLMRSLAKVCFFTN